MKNKTLRRGLARFAFAILFASPALARGGAPRDITKDGLPNVLSPSALVIDFQEGVTLFEKDADVVRPLASISKIMGALVVHEQCGLDWDALHEMSPANRDAAKGGDKTRLTTGWRFSHRDLLHAALMRSDNRALPALGEACGWDPARMAEHMTERARKLGLTKTFFREPNGLSAENVSTAREIMVILREVVKVPALTEIMTKSEHVMTGYPKGDARGREVPIRSTDRLLTRNVATIVGGKTGYTDLARYCFAVAAKTMEGRDLGMVFLGAEGKHTRFADFTRVVKWLAAKGEAAKAMLAKSAAPAPITPLSAGRATLVTQFGAMVTSALPPPTALGVPPPDTVVCRPEPEADLEKPTRTLGEGAAPR